MPRTIVIGGGISGVACAATLNDRGHTVTLLDKGRVLGGRMASRRIRDSGTPSDGHVVDIGASYFTAQDERFRSLIERLVALGVVRAWTDTFHVASSDGILGVKTGPMRYTANSGLRSIVEHLASELPDTAVMSSHDSGPISVVDDALTVNGEAVDAVAMCMPSPQARQLLDSGSPALAPALRATHEVAWEPVIAVTAVFDEATWCEFDGIFVNDDPVITWIANDGSRRGDGAPVLVAHVQPVLAARHLTDPSQVLPSALGAMQRVLGISEHPSWADAKRWTYAKPLTASPQPFFLDPGLVITLK
jgi:predicted NAD/FAD-dependent oxidoreductase